MNHRSGPKIEYTVRTVRTPIVSAEAEGGPARSEADERTRGVGVHERAQVGIESKALYERLIEGTAVFDSAET